jgi:hypothetical protein
VAKAAVERPGLEPPLPLPPPWEPPKCPPGLEEEEEEGKGGLKEEEGRSSPPKLGSWLRHYCLYVLELNINWHHLFTPWLILISANILSFWISRSIHWWLFLSCPILTTSKVILGFFLEASARAGPYLHSSMSELVDHVSLDGGFCKLLYLGKFWIIYFVILASMYIFVFNSQKELMAMNDRDQAVHQHSEKVNYKNVLFENWDDQKDGIWGVFELKSCDLIWSSFRFLRKFNYLHVCATPAPMLSTNYMFLISVVLNMKGSRCRLEGWGWIVELEIYKLFIQLSV